MNDDTTSFGLIVPGGGVTFANKSRRCAAATAGEDGTLAIAPPGAPWGITEVPPEAKTLRYRRSSDHMHLEGEFGGKRIEAELRKIPDEEFGLYTSWWR